MLTIALNVELEKRKVNPTAMGAIATDPSVKFQLEQQIQAEEARLSQVTAELKRTDALEA